MRGLLEGESQYFTAAKYENVPRIHSWLLTEKRLSLKLQLILLPNLKKLCCLNDILHNWCDLATSLG